MGTWEQYLVLSGESDLDAAEAQGGFALFGKPVSSQEAGSLWEERLLCSAF